MTLVLEIEHLTGMAYAAVSPDLDQPDWPPQPDRVFSALVATWGARGGDEAEARALQWLEAQPTPVIHAAEATARTGAIRFVPPNDAESGRSGNLAVLPSRRPRQPRRLPAAWLYDPTIRLLWPSVTPSGEVLDRLGRLAADTAYVGHSASLTRCRFSTGMPPGDTDRTPQETDPKPQAARRGIYPGRFAELVSAYDAGRRPSPGLPLRKALPKPAPEHGAFDPNWMILEHLGDEEGSGRMPDIRTAALVAKTIRDTLLSGYRRSGLGDLIPEAVSGHAPDGCPTRMPHLAIAPLGFVGFPHADGHVLGFALIPPHGSSLFANEAFLKALRQIASWNETLDRRVISVRRPGNPQEQAFCIKLSPAMGAEKASLLPGRYVGPAKRFATVTPIVLDRHLKSAGADREQEVAAQVRNACRNIGLPAPAEILIRKHAAVEGAVSAWPSERGPAWTRWQLPSSLCSRALCHAVLTFNAPVSGPVLIGAGRFLGLGLALAIDERANEG